MFHNFIQITMKKIACFTVLFFCLYFLNTAVAQSTNGMELGLRMKAGLFPLNNTELVWKQQVNDRKWHRLRVGDVNMQLLPFRSNLDLNVAYGREKRWFVGGTKGKKNQLAVVTGREVSIGSRYMGDSRAFLPIGDAQNMAFSAGANAVLGLHCGYRRLSINAEITPGIKFESVPTAESGRDFQTQLKFWNPRLSIAYRIRE